MWGQGRVGDTCMADALASLGIPAGSLGAGSKASSRGTLQQRCCFAYANELMASLDLAVTQQLQRGSPPALGELFARLQDG